MKKYSFILSIIVAVILSGCADDLKYNEVPIFDEKWVFENQGEVNGMLGVVYSHVPHGFDATYDGSGAMLSSASDESDFSVSLSSIHRYYNGAWSSVNAFPYTWASSYGAIYQANNFLEKLDKVFATLEEYRYNPALVTLLMLYWKLWAPIRPFLLLKSTPK